GMELKGEPIALSEGSFGSQYVPLRVETNTGVYVLRRLAEWMKDENINFMISTMNYLRLKGFPVSRLVAHIQSQAQGGGQFILRYSGGTYLLEEFLAKGKRLGVEENTVELASFAARLHNALGCFVPEGRGTYRVTLGYVCRRWEEFKALHQRLSAASSVRLSRGQSIFLENYAFFEEQLRMIRSGYRIGELISCVIHGDLLNKNVRYDNQNNVVALFDFDFAGLCPRVEELNNLVMGKDNPDGVLPYSHERLVRAVAAYNAGLKAKLTTGEFDAIVEIIRARFILEIYHRLVKNVSDKSHLYLDDYPNTLSQLTQTLDLFKAFSERFINGQILRQEVAAFVSSSPLNSRYKIVMPDRQYTSSRELPLVLSTRHLRAGKVVPFEGRSQRAVYVETGSIVVRFDDGKTLAIKAGDIITTYAPAYLEIAEGSFVTIISEGNPNITRGPPYNSRIKPKLTQRPSKAPEGTIPAEEIIDIRGNLMAVIYRGKNTYPSTPMLPISIASGAIGVGVKTANGLDSLHQEPKRRMEILVIVSGQAHATFTDSNFDHQKQVTLTAGQKVIIMRGTGHGFDYKNCRMIVFVQGPWTKVAKIRPASTSSPAQGKYFDVRNSLDLEKAYANIWQACGKMVRTGGAPKLLENYPVADASLITVLNAALQEKLSEVSFVLNRAFPWLCITQESLLHNSLFVFGHGQVGEVDIDRYFNPESLQVIERIFKRHTPISMELKGVNLATNGGVFVEGHLTEEALFELRADMAVAFPVQDRPTPLAQFTIGRVNQDISGCDFSRLYQAIAKLRNHSFGSIEVDQAVLVEVQDKFGFDWVRQEVINSASSPVDTGSISSLQADISKMLASLNIHSTLFTLTRQDEHDKVCDWLEGLGAFEGDRVVYVGLVDEHGDNEDGFGRTSGNWVGILKARYGKRVEIDWLRYDRAHQRYPDDASERSLFHRIWVSPEEWAEDWCGFVTLDLDYVIPFVPSGEAYMDYEFISLVGAWFTKRVDIQGIHIDRGLIDEETCLRALVSFYRALLSFSPQIITAPAGPNRRFLEASSPVGAYVATRASSSPAFAVKNLLDISSRGLLGLYGDKDALGAQHAWRVA
ncbi:MAG: phosphotransferase, partial [Candidatus Omnitrophota bacterium]